MSLHKICLAGAALLVLAGCTTTPEECDPSTDPGFLNKLGCVVSGSYAERLTQKEQAYLDLQAENELLKQMIADLEYDDALVQGSIDERNAQLDRLQQRLDRLSSSLKSKQSDSAALKSGIEKAQDQLDAMRSTPASAVKLQKTQERDELQQQLNDLTQVMAQMSGV